MNTLSTPPTAVAHGRRYSFLVAIGASIGGLLYATLMTLLVVPCMYDILSRRDLRKVDEEELQLLDM